MEFAEAEHSNEETEKCKESAKHYKCSELPLYVCGVRSNVINKEMAIFDDKIMRNEGINRSNIRGNVKRTRKIFLDLVIYAWPDEDKEHVLFISECESNPFLIATFRLSTMGINSELVADAMNKIVRYRENCFCEYDQLNYYNKTLEKVLSIQNNVDKSKENVSILKTVKEKLEEIIYDD